MCVYSTCRKQSVSEESVTACAIKAFYLEFVGKQAEKSSRSADETRRRQEPGQGPAGRKLASSGNSGEGESLKQTGAELIVSGRNPVA